MQERSRSFKMSIISILKKRNSLIPNIGLVCALGYTIYQYYSVLSCKEELIRKVRTTNLSLNSLKNELLEKNIQNENKIKEYEQKIVSSSQEEQNLNNEILDLKETLRYKNLVILRQGLQIQQKNKKISVLTTIMENSARIHNNKIIRIVTRKIAKTPSTSNKFDNLEVEKTEEEEEEKIEKPKTMHELMVSEKKPYYTSPENWKEISRPATEQELKRAIAVYKQEQRFRNENRKSNEQLSPPYLVNEAAFWMSKKRIPLAWDNAVLLDKTISWWQKKGEEYKKKQKQIKNQTNIHVNDKKEHKQGECPVDDLSDCLIDLDDEIITQSSSSNKKKKSVLVTSVKPVLNTKPIPKPYPPPPVVSLKEIMASQAVKQTDSE